MTKNFKYVVRKDYPLTSDEFLSEEGHGNTDQNTFVCSKGDTEEQLSDNTFYQILDSKDKIIFEFIVLNSQDPCCFIRIAGNEGFVYSRLTDYHHLYANYIREGFAHDEWLYKYKHYIFRDLTLAEKKLAEKIKYNPDDEVYNTTTNIQLLKVDA